MYWLQWLIDESRERHDWEAFVKLGVRKSWLLIRENTDETLREADELLSEIWNLRDEVTPSDRADLAESKARIFIKKKDYEQAKYWLDLEEDIVINASLETNSHIRHYIPVLYHKAEILFKLAQEKHHGEAHELYARSKATFDVVLELSIKLKWYRVINSSQNWLADIAIIQNDRDEANKLLTKGLMNAKASRNQRRIARYRRSWAKWHMKWGSNDKACKHAKQALKDFSRLGMSSEYTEIDKLVRLIISRY